MTLNEKYCDLVDNDNGYDNQLLADRCEKITDEHTLNFAKWIDSSSIKNTDLPMEVKYKMYKKQKRL